MVGAEIAGAIRNTIGDALQRSAERFRDRTALVFADRSWTYAALDLAADRVARRLLALGLQPGDRVCAYGRNSDPVLKVKEQAVVYGLGERLDGSSGGSWQG